MAVNEQYQGADPFGGTGGYASSGAAGSAAPPVHIAPVNGETVAVTRPGGGYYDQAAVTVDADDVLVPAQAAAYDREPVSGVTGIDATGAGQGSTGARNPNAADVPAPDGRWH